MDFFVVLVIAISILAAYCASDEIYGLNTWALF